MASSDAITKDPVAPSGDALLLGLAAHYAKAISCHLDFEDESLRWESVAHSWLSKQAMVAYQRTEPLIEAICSVPADGPAGALIQLQALSRFVGLGTDDLHLEQHWDRMREHAIASIQQVLLNLVSPAVFEAAKAMECMGPGPGPFVTDLGEYEAEMKRHFEAEDIDLVPNPKFRRRKGGA